MRYAMMIDLTRCVGCQACVSACKEQWDSGAGAARAWVRTFEHGSRGQDLAISFYPGLCMQCQQHPCTTDCPTGATTMNDQGIVVVDPRACIGCGNCISNCPYGARHYDPEKKIVEKCNLCEPFVARGELPACVSTCLAECRHFGDLDDATGTLVKRIAETGAQPLVTAAVDVGPKVTFAGRREREQILANGQIRAPRPSWLTSAWSGASRPIARYVAPALALATLSAGVLVNALSRRREQVAAGEASAPPAREEAARTPAAETNRPAELPRHRAGMRFLHWFNAASWVLLLATGTALMSARRFALFGEGLPRWLAGLFGGVAPLLRFHVLWGLLWAALIVPLFLLYKGGGREALKEIRLRRSDLTWLALKPLSMLGLTRVPLPPQDKYNAGQKVFAVTALLGTATIIASGLTMTFHLGSSDTVAAAILIHQLAIAFALMGLAVHLMMAAIIRDERPALKSMITGQIERGHAERHSARWVEELSRETPPATRSGANHE